MIKSSPSPAEAKEALIARGWECGDISEFLERAGSNACRPEELPEHFGQRDGKYYLSPEQAQAILELRLHRLTGMEHDKLLAEYQEKLVEIADYLDILGSPLRLMTVIREELEAIVAEFNDPRRTEIIESKHDLTVEDLITEEDRVVTISHGGYAKTQPLTDYQAQRRGGMGKSATQVKDEDFVEHLLIASTHTTVLCFTNAGKVYWLKVYQIPVAGRQSRGRPMVNLLPLGEGERVTSILPVDEYSEDKFIFMATANGTVKKTPLPAFARQRSVGLIAIDLVEGNRLVGTAITDGECDVMLFSSGGKAARLRESNVRSMGRTAKGVRGIRIPDDQCVLSLIIPQQGGKVLAVSENGYGKQTPVEDFPTKGRGGMGVKAIQSSERNGQLVGAEQVFEGDEVMLISDQGTLVRTRCEEIATSGRNTQGVRVIRLKKDEKLVGLARIEEQDEENEIVEATSAEAGAEKSSAGDDEQESE